MSKHRQGTKDRGPKTENRPLSLPCLLKTGRKIHLMTDQMTLIQKLYHEQTLSPQEYLSLIRLRTALSPAEREELSSLARSRAEEFYGKKVFLRGLIEFSNYCRNNCYYCGIRRGNTRVHRFRLDTEEIVACAGRGYELGFRTAVLQSGEDPYFTDEMICRVIVGIKELHPDMVVTLSIGEKNRESYEAYYRAGARRYLLRHETADEKHYRFLHPSELSLKNRMECLYTLREIGFQIGAGFMVGSPGQTDECYAEDLVFLDRLDPHMIGIGPFIPHQDTPFAKEHAGTAEDTLFFLSVLRLAHPRALIPATTALGTIDPVGREKGILAGANVVMPNLTPTGVRGDYLLYDGKICTGDEAAECRRCMERRVEKIGYHVSVEAGDSMVDHPDPERDAAAHERGDLHDL